MGQKSCRPRHPRPQAVPRHAHARVLTPSTIPRPISRLATCWETVGFTGSSTPEARAGPDLGWPLQKPKPSRRYLIVCLRHPTEAFLPRPASGGPFCMSMTMLAFPIMSSWGRARRSARARHPRQVSALSLALTRQRRRIVQSQATRLHQMCRRLPPSTQSS